MQKKGAFDCVDFQFNLSLRHCERSFRTATKSGITHYHSRLWRVRHCERSEAIQNLRKS